MKKLLLLLIVLLGFLMAFALGRMSAPAPTFEAAALSAADPLGEAFEDFLRAQRDTVALLRNSPFFESEQERAEAYRGYLYSLVSALKARAFQTDTHPHFMRAVDWTSKRGLDNPDNNYYVAIINDRDSYRIRGNRGNTSDLAFQLVVGEPGVRGAGTSTNVSVLYGTDMQLAPNGDFEIIVSRDDPGDGVNWLANGGGARTLIVRHTHSDWLEVAPQLTIERIGAEGEPAPLLSASAMALAMQDAGVSLYDSTATWLTYAERAWTLMPRNNVSAARPSQGGLVGQYSAFGTWELGEDQALVLDVAASDARYQGVELGNLWFVSLNYESRTSSLTREQSYCGKDGRCDLVIAHRDPGVQNWLDTEGHARGLIMLRWQGLPAALEDAQQPRATLVPFGEIRQHLPADVPVFSAEDRARQIRERRIAVQRRAG